MVCSARRHWSSSSRTSSRTTTLVSSASTTGRSLGDCLFHIGESHRCNAGRSNQSGCHERVDGLLLCERWPCFGRFEYDHVRVPWRKVAGKLHSHFVVF